MGQYNARMRGKITSTEIPSSIQPLNIGRTLFFTPSPVIITEQWAMRKEERQRRLPATPWHESLLWQCLQIALLSLHLIFMFKNFPVRRKVYILPSKQDAQIIFTSCTGVIRFEMGRGE